MTGGAATRRTVPDAWAVAARHAGAAAADLRGARRPARRMTPSSSSRACTRPNPSARSMPRRACWRTPSMPTVISSSLATSIAMAPPARRSRCAACACSAPRVSAIRCRIGSPMATDCRRRWWRTWWRSQPDLLVTVDSGIACHAGVAAAKARGWQVLITDHHLPGAQLPPADVIVNPNLDGDAFPSKALAGVGVMFYSAARAASPSA